MEEPPCYVFKTKRDRPLKKRRLNNHFTGEDIARRQALFEELWQNQEQRVTEAINASNETSLGEVVRFLDTASSLRKQGKIPTALIVTGPTTSINFFQELESQVTDANNDVFITLASSDGPNLKTLLKSVISKVTEQQIDSDDETTVPSTRGREPRLLNYDLRIVQEWTRKRRVQHLILNIRRSEAFDVNVFTDFIALLHSWLDRLPIVLLVGIATSVDIFQERLPQGVVKCMQGERIDIAESSHVMEEVLKCCSARSAARVHLGPDLAASLVQWHRDHLPSVEACKHAIKYAYMSHFHGNALSIFTSPDVSFESIKSSHLEAIRRLPSFQSHIEQVLNRKEASMARALLRSDVRLFEETIGSVQSAQTILEWLCGAVSIVQRLCTVLPGPPNRVAMSFSSLYVKALAGSLDATSPIIRDLLLTIRHLHSDVFMDILSDVVDVLISMPPSSRTDTSPDFFLDIQSELSELVSNHGPLQASKVASTFPSRRADGSGAVTSSVLTSTSEGKYAKSRAHNGYDQYTSLIAHFHNLMTTYFNDTLPRSNFAHPCFTSTTSTSAPATWFPHEIIILTSKSIHTAAFTPAPRAVIERALSRPGDYLGNPSCRDAGRHPATAVLYQLYCESGSLVNVADLWTAFRARVAPARDAPLAGLTNGIFGEEEGHADAQDVLTNGRDESTELLGQQRPLGQENHDIVIRALFFRALAELKYLGMVKQTRKRLDCVQKVLWPGV